MLRCVRSQCRVTEHAGIRLRSGVRWSCSPEEEPTDVSTSGLDALNRCTVAVYLGGFGVEYESFLHIVCVRACACVHTSPPPGQGRDPQCEIQ